MISRMMHLRRARAGFTLIELLVVISIILVLTGLGVLFVPKIAERQRASGGASSLQSWLLIAKMRALRDKAPRGIRLNLGTGSNPGYVTDLQYIEQPPDFSGGRVTNINGNAVTFDNVDFYGGFGPTDASVWPVQPGDSLEIKGGGRLYRIKTVNANGNLGTALTLDSVAAPVWVPTTQYRIIRQPRVLAGEDPLQLPQDVAIDLAKSRLGKGVPLSNFASGYIDILFDRNGTVLGLGAGADKFILWVRDITLDDNEGDETLVTVYTRSGAIEAHPVNWDTNLGDFYVFTEEGRSSGE